MSVKKISGGRGGGEKGEGKRRVKPLHRDECVHLSVSLRYTLNTKARGLVARHNKYL